MNLKKIVTEWFYRLPAGYANPPYTPSDVEVLKQVLMEYNISNWQQAISYIAEMDTELDLDATDTPETEPETHESNEDFRNLLDSFEQFSDIVHKRYITPGLEVNGLTDFYNKLIALPDSLRDQMRRIIGKRTNRDIYNGTFQMGQYERMLYDLVNENIKIPNISSAVFWFAIVLDGKIKGGDSDTIVSGNISVESSTVSLQNFHNEVVSFGMLDPEIISILTIIVNLGEVIDGEKPTDLSRTNINSLLDKISDDENKQELTQFLNMSNISKLASLKSLSNNIKAALENQNLDELPIKFCSLIDSYIAKILSNISYWGTIRGDMVYLTSGDSLFPALNCTKENKLGGGIFNIKDNKINIIGDIINEKLI